MIRPSSLPMLAVCPRYVPAPDTGELDKSAGTARHDAMAAALLGREPDWSLHTDDEREKVEWAIDYIRLKSPAGETMMVEQRRELVGEDFEVIYSGTPDVTCGHELFDLKWRERDYAAQMAAYALAMMTDEPWMEQYVNVHVLFAERKHVQTYRLTSEDAWAIVGKILHDANSPASEPKACDYCGWCANRLTCPALTAPVQQIADARGEVGFDDAAKFSEWLAAGAHSSDMNSPELSGAVLRIARTIGTWCEAVEHHCKALAVKQGITPAGYKIQNRQGNRFIASVMDAFARTGLDQDQFLPLCEIKFAPLAEKLAAVRGMKKSQAERELESKLGDCLQRKAPSVSLVAEKSTGT